MDWMLRRDQATADDPHALSAFLTRLEEEIAAGGPKLAGFTFLQDSREMFALSRQIEGDLLESAANGPLYVGFQNTEKLSRELPRYQRLKRRGVRTLAFGEGAAAPGWEESIEAWYELAPDHVRLENQWFLVTMTPAPIAFVGWEVSDEAIWGRFGVTSEGKQFAGFVSDDERLVAAMIAELDRVRAVHLPPTSTAPQSTTSYLMDLRPRTVLAIVDDGHREFLRRGLPATIAACSAAGADLLLYDITSASYLTNPYPNGDPSWHHPMDARMLRQLGRDYAAKLVDEAARGGVQARVVLPYGVGFSHLAGWCEREAVGAIILPVE